MAQATAGGSKTMSVPEAAQFLGISNDRAWKSVWDGTIPSVRFGRRVRIPRHSLEKLLGITDRED